MEARRWPLPPGPGGEERLREGAGARKALAGKSEGARAPEGSIGSGGCRPGPVAQHL